MILGSAILHLCLEVRVRREWIIADVDAGSDSRSRPKLRYITVHAADYKPCARRNLSRRPEVNTR